MEFMDIMKLWQVMERFISKEWFIVLNVAMPLYGKASAFIWFGICAFDFTPAKVFFLGSGGSVIKALYYFLGIDILEILGKKIPWIEKMLERWKEKEANEIYKKMYERAGIMAIAASACVSLGIAACLYLIFRINFYKALGVALFGAFISNAFWAVTGETFKEVIRGCFFVIYYLIKMS